VAEPSRADANRGSGKGVGMSLKQVAEALVARAKPGPKLRPLAERFWSKVERRNPNECWPWLGAKGKEGYGRVHRGDRRMVLAHRVAYELAVGPVPHGLELDHVKARGCTRRDCVNPAHLEPVTRRVNLLRGDTITASNAAKTVCKRGHTFDHVRQGKRYCSTCETDAARVRWANRSHA